MTEKTPFLKQILSVESQILASESELDFPHKVQAILKNSNPFSFEGFDSLKDCMHLARTVPQYYAPKAFGKFNLTLVNNGKFFITVMFMDQLGTEIHTHPFWGCFTPLLGSPYEITFDFNHLKSLDKNLDIGELTPIQAKLIEVNQPVMIEENTIHLLSRPSSGQFSLLIGQLLPQEKRTNHFFYHPGLRVKNRTDYSYIQRLLTLMESSPLSETELHGVVEKLELDEIFRMLQFTRYGANRTAQGMIEKLIQQRHQQLWQYVESHDSYMTKLQSRLSHVF